MRFSLLILPSMSFLCFPFNKTKAQRSFKVVPLISFQTRYWFQSLFPWPVFCSPPSASVGSKPWQFLEVGADLKVAPTQGEQGETVKRHWCRLVCCRCFCSVTKFCPTLCDPVNYSVPGSSVHGIFQARILKWVTIYFSRESSWPRNPTHVSCIGRRILYHLAAREAIYNLGIPILTPPGSQTPRVEYSLRLACRNSLLSLK